MYKKILFSLIFISLAVLLWNLNKTKLTAEVNPFQQNELKANETPLEEKIGQMLIVGFRGAEYFPSSPTKEMIKDVKPGGVILFDYDNPSQGRPRNITDPVQVKSLINNLQEISKTPLFIAVDAEGGMVNRLKKEYGFLDIPSHQELGEKNNLEQTKKITSLLAQELKLLGFNLNFAPVVDLNVNPSNPIIGKLKRSFSSDPEIVTSQAKIFIETLHKNNIISSLKHFPGHGSSNDDSHLGLVDITNTWKKEELAPYKNIINDGLADMIMVAHVMNINIDPDFPASLSPIFVKKIIREQLKFNGVVISDDLNMGAISKNFGFEESIIKAINAGCDMLILSNNGETYNEDTALKARNIIFEAIKNGEISAERINESYNRIQNLKQVYGIDK